MRRNQWAAALAVFAMAAATSTMPLPAAESAGSADPFAAGMVLVRPKPATGPCAIAEVTANPTRPVWDNGASTTQCGIVEMDSGWMLQPMGGGVRQQVLTSSMRYGLTPKLDLRWGLTGPIAQYGGGTAPLEGIGDQWLNARYRFFEQSRRMPAMAFLYGIKIPTANRAKGFGSGFADHQLLLIASRDLGRNHLDFNAVGNLLGDAHGHDGAAQFGLVVTRQVTPKLSWMLESYGGPQPGTSNRFGAALTGAAYSLRPSLVVDAAYSRTYTAGSPRQQFLVGMTFAMRPGFAPIPTGSSMARLLGR